MKSITIHGIDTTLGSLLKERALLYGTSINKTIKKLLSEALGLTTTQMETRRKEFLDLFGVWSQDDEKQFSSRVKPFERIAKDDWRTE